MHRIPERSRLPVLIGISLLGLVVVAGAVTFIPRLLSPAPASSAPPLPTASSVPPRTTPESAVRAFFDALIDARRTDDPTPIEPYVTDVESSAYRTVAAFLDGQRETRKASVTTLLEFRGIEVDETGDQAQLRATLLEAGYDVDLDSGEPRESPVTLDPRSLTVELRRMDGEWKVESFETASSGAVP